MTDLPEYHRCDAKPAWWKDFDRLDRSPQELCAEDSAAIGSPGTKVDLDSFVDMAVKRSPAEKERDARRNEAARRELVARDRERTLTANLEEALTLQRQATEFADAFAVRRSRRL